MVKCPSITQTLTTKAIIISQIHYFEADFPEVETSNCPWRGCMWIEYLTYMSYVSYLQAKCRGVQPELLRLLMLAPWSNKHCTVWKHLSIL